MGGNRKRFGTFSTNVGANCGDNCSCSSSSSDSSPAQSSASGSGSSSGSQSGAQSDASGANGTEGLIRNAARRVGLPLGGNADDSDDEGADGDADDSNEGADEGTSDDGEADSGEADDDDADEPAGNDGGPFPTVPDTSNLPDVGVMSAMDAADRAADPLNGERTPGVISTMDAMDAAEADDADTWVSRMYQEWDDGEADSDEADAADGDADDEGDEDDSPPTGNATRPGAGANRLPPNFGSGSSGDGGADASADGFHDVGVLTGMDADDAGAGGPSSPAGSGGRFAGRGVGGVDGGATEDGEHHDVGVLTHSATDGE